MADEQTTSEPQADARSPIGRASATDRDPNTSEEFGFWLAPQVIVNPFDIVGVAVLISAGRRCASVVHPAMAGAIAGLLIRGTLHLLMF